MVKLFTHTDLDGVGCAVLAKMAFGDDVDITYCNYDDINSEVEKFLPNCEEHDMCFITDISVKEDVAQKIDDSCMHFYGLDHHPTALELNKFIWFKVKITDEDTGIKTSGTEMFYHWLVDNGYLKDRVYLKIFAELVRNYDTWRWTEIENGLICKQVNDLFDLYGRHRFIIWCLSEIHDCTFPRFYAADELVLKIRQMEIDEYVEQKDKEMFTQTICGKVCGLVFAERFISELGNYLCKMHSEVDYVAMIDMSGCTVSYRSVKEDIDLGKDVAKLFGGGGHPKAAGSRFSKPVQLKMINEIFS